jgi:hypothetical protein
MAIRFTATAVALALLAAGCGGGGPSRRDVVSEYITKVNQIEVSLGAPSRAIATASRQLVRKGASHTAAEARLRGAARQIDGLRRRLAAVAAPPEARRLRSLLLDLSSREASVARELAALAAFLPAFVTALQPLADADKDLQAALKAKSPATAKAAALEKYAARVARIRHALELLRPPPVSAPGHAAQIAALTRIRSSALALAKALREQDANAIPQLLHRFNVATVSNQSLAAQRARIDAVRTYNARVHSLDALQTRIYRERTRLQKTLS